MPEALKPSPRLQLLVVEDHDALREVTIETLTAAGHHVVGVGSAEAVDDLPASFRFEIAILDLNLPGENGLSLANRLRRLFPNVGIIMVTVRHALADKVAGYDRGADLYLTKPTEPQELCAAVLALARRVAPGSMNPQSNGFILDCATHILQTPKGPLILNDNEARLLQCLALAPDQFMANGQLLEQLDTSTEAQGKNQLEVVFSRLRTKLLAHGSLPGPLPSVRDQGYRLGFALHLA